jgi:hypothetical protein
MLLCTVCYKFTDVSEEEAVSTSETSVSFYQTAQYNIPEHSRHHTLRRENLDDPYCPPPRPQVATLCHTLPDAVDCPDDIL